MLDLITNENLAANNATRRHNGDIFAHHKSLDDVSLFEQYAKIRRVPIEAIIPIRGFDGDLIQHPEPITKYSALYNDATGTVLETRPVAETYKLVPHDVMFKRSSDIIQSSGLPLNDIDIYDNLYDGGRRSHRVVFFNDLKETIADSSDVVRCRLDIFNSVDGTWKFQVFSGAYRDLCRNTQVFGGKKAYQQNHKHTKNLSPDAMVTKAGLALQLWEGQVDAMRTWRMTRMNEEQFGEIIKATICKPKGAAAEHGVRSQVNERLYNYLIHRFREELPELGKTMWAGYNALTHWSTHVDEEYTTDDGKTYQTGKKTANKADVRRNRATDVRAVIESDEWKAFEGVAA